MAQILQINSKAKEMYLGNANIPNSKYLLIVYDNDVLVLKWCCGNVVEVQSNPIMVKVGRKMILEYGEPNLFGVRRQLTFQDENGNLNSNWERIL